MPRRYRMGERATQVQATRARILDAAIELYTEVGISAATTREIGMRADVAPGTLRTHFPSRQALDKAVIETMAAEVVLPDRSLFEGARSMDERMTRLIAASGTFLGQARRLYRMWLREPMLSGPWLAKGAEYGARWDELIRIALGPLADDDVARAVLRAVLHPEFFDSVAAGMRSTAETSAVVSSLVAPWMVARAGR